MSLTRSDDGNFVATVMSGAFKANLNWITNVIRDCFGLLFFVMWLAKKTRTTYSTNQIKN